MGAGEAMRDKERNIISDPSDDKLIPLAPHDTLLAQTSFPTLDPTRNKERGGNMKGNCPNPNTPKRDGESRRTKKWTTLAKPRQVRRRIWP